MITACKRVNSLLFLNITNLVMFFIPMLFNIIKRSLVPCAAQQISSLTVKKLKNYVSPYSESLHIVNFCVAFFEFTI